METDAVMEPTRTPFQKEINTIRNPFMLDTPDHLIIQRSDFIYKSNKDFTRVYHMKARFLDVDHVCDAFKVARIGCENVLRVLVAHKNPPNQSYYSIRKLVDHPFLVKSYEYYEDSYQAFIADEYFQGQNLYNYVVDKISIPEEEAAQIARQLLYAVNFLHQNYICLRGIVPGHVMVKHDKHTSIKLTGFKNACFCAYTTTLEEACPINNFTAPEVVEAKYNTKCDVWSIGAILYFMLGGELPFDGNEDTLPERILSAKLSFFNREWEDVSLEAKEFVMKLLNPDPKKRIPADEALIDHWILKYKPKIDQAEMDEAFMNMAKYEPKNKLQEMIWFYITDSIISSNETAELALIFEALDVGNNGRLSKIELVNKYPEDAVDHIMSHLDLNKSGYLEYSEFLMGALSRKRYLTPERIIEAFKMIDNNKDGYITFSDLKMTFLVYNQINSIIIRSGDVTR